MAPTPPMLAGLLKVAASDPKLKGLVNNVGQSQLHITGIDQARPWLSARSRTTRQFLL